MENELMTLNDFLGKANFVLANRVTELYDYFSFETIGNPNTAKIIQFYLTDLSLEDAEFYANKYGVSFVFSEELDMLIFINDKTLS